MGQFLRGQNKPRALEARKMHIVKRVCRQFLIRGFYYSYNEYKLRTTGMGNVNRRLGFHLYCNKTQKHIFVIVTKQILCRVPIYFNILS